MPERRRGLPDWAERFRAAARVPAWFHQTHEIAPWREGTMPPPARPVLDAMPAGRSSLSTFCYILMHVSGLPRAGFIPSDHVDHDPEVCPAAGAILYHLADDPTSWPAFALIPHTAREPKLGGVRPADRSR